MKNENSAEEHKVKMNISQCPLSPLLLPGRNGFTWTISAVVSSPISLSIWVNILKISFSIILTSGRERAENRCSSWPAIFIWTPASTKGSPGGSDSKESACNAGGPGSIPGLGRSSGEGNGNPLQDSCLKNSMDRGAWLVTVPGVAKSCTYLYCS